MRYSATSDASKMEFYNLSLLQVDGWETINASEEKKFSKGTEETEEIALATSGCPSEPNRMENLAHEAKGAKRVTSRFVRKRKTRQHRGGSLSVSGGNVVNSDTL